MALTKGCKKCCIKDIKNYEECMLLCLFRCVYVCVCMCVCMCMCITERERETAFQKMRETRSAAYIGNKKGQDQHSEGAPIGKICREEERKSENKYRRMN